MSQTITLTAEQAKAFNNGESIIIESPKRHNVVVAVSREGRIYRIINAIWDGKGYKGSFELLFPYTKGTSAFGYFHENGYNFIEWKSEGGRVLYFPSFDH